MHFFDDKLNCKAEYSLINKWHNKQREAVHLSCCEVWHLHVHPQGDTVTQDRFFITYTILLITSDFPCQQPPFQDDPSPPSLLTCQLCHLVKPNLYMWLLLTELQRQATANETTRPILETVHTVHQRTTKASVGLGNNTQCFSVGLCTQIFTNLTRLRHLLLHKWYKYNTRNSVTHTQAHTITLSKTHTHTQTHSSCVIIWN